MTNKVTSIIKKYFFLLALVAMVGGFSAFRVSNVQSTFWYEVNPMDGSISNTHNPNLAALCPAQHQTDYCAIELDALTPPPANIADTDVEGGPVETKSVRFRNP